MKIPYPSEPLFTEIYGERVLRPELAMDERDGVLVIAEHWVTHMHLVLELKRGGFALVTGGTEGQDVPEAAIREVRQESGYQHMLFLRTIGTFHAASFHPVKRQNLRARLSVAYLMVNDNSCSPISPAELDLHRPRWVSRRHVADVLTVPSHLYAWKSFFSKA